MRVLCKAWCVICGEQLASTLHGRRAASCPKHYHRWQHQHQHQHHRRYQQHLHRHHRRRRRNHSVWLREESAGAAASFLDGKGGLRRQGVWRVEERGRQAAKRVTSEVMMMWWRRWAVCEVQEVPCVT